MAQTKILYPMETVMNCLQIFEILNCSLSHKSKDFSHASNKIKYVYISGFFSHISMVVGRALQGLQRRFGWRWTRTTVNWLS